MLIRSLLAGASLLAIASAAQAAPITTFTESLTTPLTPPGSVLTPIRLNGVGIIPPSQNIITGTGYSVTFTEPANQGVVKGTTANLHAIPVAGVNGGAPVYLMGDYLSATTADPTMAGNYFSTDAGNNKITITFTTVQTSLALLAGSIDAQNLITLSGGGIVGSDTLTGTQLQAVPGFAGNGNQGFGGSAYVSLTDAAGFTTVTLSSGVVSFEAAGIAGSNVPFNVPEPMSLALLGSGLAVMGLVRRRNRA